MFKKIISAVWIALTATLLFASSQANALTSQTISFPALPDQPFGVAPFTVSATATSGLPVTIASYTPSVCSVSGSTVTLVTTGWCELTANQAGNGTYSAAAQIMQTFNVLPAQTITFPALGSQSYGTNPVVAATASSGLTVTFSSLTPSICAMTYVGAGYVSLFSSGTCSIAANQAGNSSYAAAPQVVRSFTVVAAAQSINFPALTSPHSGAPQSTFALSATATSGLAVTFSSTTPSVCTVSGATATMVSPGTCTIAADQAGNGAYLAAPEVKQSVTLISTQTINLSTIPTQVYSITPFMVPVTASSGLPVSLSTNTPKVCTASGTTVTLTGSGTCYLLADQAGNGSYAAAPEIYETFTVTTGNQTISFNAPPNQPYGTAPFALSATASSGLPVTFTSYSQSICTVSGSTVTLVGVGVCEILAAQAGNAGMNPASSVMQTFTVTLGSQTINFPPLPNIVFGVTQNPIVATASTGFQVTFASTTPPVCNVTGNTINVTMTGTCTVVASQSGNSYYAAAPNVTQSFTINQLNFTALPTVVFGPAPIALSASAVSGLPVTFSSSTPTVCTASGATASLVGVGTCTLVANSAGNSQWQATQATQSFNVTQANQTISFNPLANVTYGAAPFILTATASSGLPVSYANYTPSVCAVSGSTVTTVAPGLCQLVASQTGNSNYTAATAVAQSFYVIQTINFPQIPSQTYSALWALPLTATANSGLPVNFSVSSTSMCALGGAPLGNGIASSGYGCLYPQGLGTCTITATQPGQSGVPAAAPVTQTFTILPDNQTIGFKALPASYNGPLQSTLSLSATASSGLAVTFSSSTPSVCTVSGSTITFVWVGTCTIAADQTGGNINGAIYGAAPEVTQSVSFVGTQVINFAALPDQPFGVAPFTVSATASSGLPVTFSSLTTNACTVSGTTVTLVAGGTCTIAANQVGGTNYSGAPRVTQSFAVVLAGQAMTLTPSAITLSANANSVAMAQSMMFATTITGNNPTGTVIFMDGTSVLGSATVTNGQATLTTSFATIGAHGITAVYGGDANNASSVSTLVIINVLDLWISLSNPINGDAYNDQTTIYMRTQVTGASGDDVVTFNLNGQTIAATPDVTLGAYYANQSVARSSTPYQLFATVTQGTVTRESNLSTFTVGAAGSAMLTINTPTVSGTTVNLSANATAVSGAVVQFYANGSPINTGANPATNNNGAWSYTWTNVPAGVYTISAQLVGITGSTLAQQTAAGTVVVGGTTGGTTLVASATTIASNQTLTLTANVFGNNPNASVTFFDGTTSLGTAWVTNGQATITASFSNTSLHSLTAKYAGDTNNPSSTSAPVFVQSNFVALLNQTINFPQVSNQQYGTGSFTISATSSSGLPITFGYFPTWVCSATGTQCYTVPGVCSVSGNTVTILSTGTCTLIASVDGNNTYAAAAVTQSFTVGSTAPDVTFSAPANGSIYSTGPITPATPMGSVPVVGSANPGPGASIVSIAVMVDNNIYGSPVPGASVNMTASLPVGNHTVYLQATDSLGKFTLSDTVTVSVLYGNGQIISFAPLSGTVGPAPFTISATATSGLPVTFSSTTQSICTVSGSTVTIVASGTCTIAADQAGNNSFTAAPEATLSFTVVGPTSATPAVTLSASDYNVSVGNGMSAAITITGSATESGSQIDSLALYEDNGSGNGYGSTPVATVLGANLSQTLNLPVGSYLFQLAAIDAQGHSANSAPVSVNVTSNTPGGGNQYQPRHFASVTLSASNNNVRITSGTTATVTFTANAVEFNGSISSIALRQNTGSGYNQTPVASTSGGITTPQIYALPLTAGSYLFQLTATDANGATATSTPVVVNVTNSSVLGEVKGVEVTIAGAPQLFGWVCQSGNSTGLNYHVYRNAPSTLGGTLLTQGVANVIGQPDDATVQGNCGTSGSSHNFIVDLSSYTSQYAGTPLYVEAADSNGHSVVLPCADNNCTMPGSLRIGLTTPSPLNTDQYSAPATIFLRSLLTNGSGPYDQIAFKINGPGITTPTIKATADTSPGAYYAAVPSLSPGVYTVTAFVQQGDMTLYSTENIVTVVPGSGSIALTSPTAGSQSAPITLSATASGTSLSSAVVQFYGNGSPIGGNITPDSNGVATYAWTNPQSNTYAITARLLSGGGEPLAETAITTITVGGSNTGTLMPIGATPIPVAINSPLLSALLNGDDAGTLPGSLNVGHDGAATYSIPIVVPPGTGGLAPSLSVNYSSNGNNGMLGLGWSLGGMSSIYRCSKTIAQDGLPGRISFDNADRLCLDGQRLLRADGANPGTDLTAIDTAYWATGAQYRTELESFSRITRQANGGFKVEAKNGKISYYGIDAGSAIAAQGRSDGQPLLWALARTQDRSGNYLTVSYNQDATTGEYTPNQILYGGNTAAAQSPDLAVRFVYEARSDAQIMYLGGSRNDLRTRLTHVQTYSGIAADGSGGTLLRDHTLHYTTSANTGRSMIDWMQACAPNLNTGITDCLPKTTFDWGQQALAFQQSASFTIPFNNNDVYHLVSGSLDFSGDFDGSGLPGILIPTVTITCPEFAAIGCAADPNDNGKGNNNAPIAVWTGNMTEISFGGVQTQAQLAWPGITPPTQITTKDLMVGDLDGNGFDDIVFGTTSGWAYCLNDGSANFQCHIWPVPPTAYINSVTNTNVLDMFGAKRTHILFGLSQDCYLGDDGTMGCHQVDAVNTTPAPTGYMNPLQTPTLAFSVIDFSKQGISDFYSLFSLPIGPQIPQLGGVATCINKQPVIAGSVRVECQTITQWPTLAGGLSAGNGDLNGDGLTDFVFAAPSGVVYVCLSQENGANCQPTSVATWAAPATGNVPYAMDAQIGDFTGDGTNTLLIRRSATSADLCRLNAKPDFDCQTIALPNNSSAYGQWYLKDINGTGIPQFIYYGVGQTTVNTTTNIDLAPALAYTLAAPAAQDKLIGVTNGVGQREEVDYARGDDAGTYQRFAVINGVTQRPVYPQVSMPPPTMAKQLRHSNGQGGWLQQSYLYAGAFSDAHGRGGSGFSQVQSTDMQTGIVTISTFNQSFPFTGMVMQSQTVAPGQVVLSSTSNNPEQQAIALPSGAQSIFVDVSQSVTVRHDLDGSDLGTTTTLSHYTDGWGNLNTQTVTATAAGQTFTSQTATTFSNDSSGWLLGLPLSVAVTKTDPVSGSLTRTTGYTYDSTTGLLQTETIEPGTPQYQVTTTYDRTGNPFGLVNRKIQSWLDPACQVANWPDPGCQSNKTRNVADVTYDSKGRFPSTSRNALGQQQSFVYDQGTGVMLSTTDANLLTTTRLADGFGRVYQETHADGNQSRYYTKACAGDCPAFATIASIVDTFHGTDRIAVPTVAYGDSANHVVRKQTWGFDGSLIDTDMRYDVLGRLFETDYPRYDSDTAYLASRQFYDLLNRVTTVVVHDEAGAEQTATTQYQGLVTTHTNARQQQRVDTRNAAGELAQVRDANLGLTQFGYDPFGNLNKTTDPANNTVIVGYDNWGRKTSLQDPDLGLITYSVDPVGRTYQQVNPLERSAGHPTNIVFDLLDRMVLRSEPDLTSIWAYDQLPAASANALPAATAGLCSNATNGKLMEAYTWIGTAGSGSKDYDRVQCYDSQGRSTATVTSLYSNTTFTSITGYDAWGRLSSISHQPGSSAAPKLFAQYYNGNGYLAQVARISGSGNTTTAQVLWQANQQDAADRVLQAALGNGLTVKRSYFANTGLLQDGDLSNAGNTQVLHEGYFYDVLGNVSERTQFWNTSQNGYTEDFAYDALNRLSTSQVAPNGTTSPGLQTFSYDSLGNITGKTGVGTGIAGSYHYGGAPQAGCISGSVTAGPHAVTAIDGYSTFCYDANGNLLAGAGRSMTWNSFDMPVSISNGQSTSTFTYGPEHQRTRQTRDGSIIVYAESMEMDIPPVGGATIKTYWPMGLGVEIDAPNNAASQLRWTHSDRLGSIVAITDESGALAESMAYDAWGSRRDANGDPGVIAVSASGQLDGQTEIDNKGFTGQEMLDKLALVHLNGRVYDPLTGKFLSGDPEVTDPINGQNYNRYSYVLNNPTNLIDPTGFGAEGKSDNVPKVCDAKCLEALEKGKKTGETVRVDVGNGKYIEVAFKDGDWTTISVFQTKSISNTLRSFAGKAANSGSAGESRTWGSYLPGTGAGDNAAQWYADRQEKSGNPLWAIPGSFAALWTPDTAAETTFNLAGGEIASGVKFGLTYAGSKIIGASQATGTFGHALVSDGLAYLYALNPNVERVTLDLGYRRLMEGVQDMVYKYGPRPDVGVLFKDGSVKAVEVASKTDIPENLVRRNAVKMGREGIQGTQSVNNWAVWLNRLFGN